MHEIDLDEYVLQVEITDLTDIKGDFRSWGSPEDYHGCRELEFKVVSGIGYDDDGTVALTDDELEQIAERHAGLIEGRLWQAVDDASDLDALERAEARAERYAA